MPSSPVVVSAGACGIIDNIAQFVKTLSTLTGMDRPKVRAQGVGVAGNGAPGRTRTCYPRLRRPPGPAVL